MSQEDVRMTAGITNIPLTKPAKVFFVCKDKVHYDMVTTLLENSKIPFTITWTKNGTVAHIISNDELPASRIKIMWRNFKTLHPKFHTRWRYLFYEIDNKDNEILQSIINIYKEMQLPVYIHESMKGFHFLSLKPIDKETFKKTIERLRVFNERYPPITLRIIPNKHEGEQEIFKRDFIVSEKYHYDTSRLEQLMLKQDIETIGQYYQVVWYKI